MSGLVQIIDQVKLIIYNQLHKFTQQNIIKTFFFEGGPLKTGNCVSKWNKYKWLIFPPSVLQAHISLTLEEWNTKPNLNALEALPCM